MRRLEAREAEDEVVGAAVLAAPLLVAVWGSRSGPAIFSLSDDLIRIYAISGATMDAKVTQLFG
jgi:hypothetical protein